MLSQIPRPSEWRQCKARGLEDLFLDHFGVTKKPRQIDLKNASHQGHCPTLQKHTDLITRPLRQGKLNTATGKKYYISNGKCQSECQFPRWRVIAKRMDMGRGQGENKCPCLYMVNNTPSVLFILGIPDMSLRYSSWRMGLCTAREHHSYKRLLPRNLAFPVTAFFWPLKFRLLRR